MLSTTAFAHFNNKSIRFTHLILSAEKTLRNFAAPTAIKQLAGTHIMKQQRENEPKNWIGNQTTGIVKKIAGIILLIATSMNAVSFNTHKSIIHGSDTAINQLQKMHSVYNTVMAGKPYFKSHFILVPISNIQSQAVAADIESARLFVKELKQRQTWSLDLSTAQKNADNEMNFNFQLNRVLAVTEISTKADEMMMDHFAEDISKQSTLFGASLIAEADAEIMHDFIATNFSISLEITREDRLIADDEIRSAFLLPY